MEIFTLMKSFSNFFCFRSLLLKTHQLPLDAYVVALKGMKVNKVILKGSLGRFVIQGPFCWFA